MQRAARLLPSFEEISNAFSSVWLLRFARLLGSLRRRSRASLATTSWTWTALTQHEVAMARILLVVPSPRLPAPLLWCFAG